MQRRPSLGREINHRRHERFVSWRARTLQKGVKSAIVRLGGRLSGYGRVDRALWGIHISAQQVTCQSAS